MTPEPARPQDPTATERAEFGFPGPLRDRLVAAVLDGSKTATTGLVADYEHEGQPLPEAGDRAVVVDSQDRPVAVIEVTGVRVVPLAQADAAHAVAEGEGHAGVAEWRAEHERFWNSEEMRAALGDPGFTVDDATPVVLERFRLVADLRTTTTDQSLDGAGPGAPTAPDPVLTEAIADAVRRAVRQLRAEQPGPFCVFALVTTGEAFRPYLIVTPDGPGRWDLADSPYAVYGDEHFADVARRYAERGDLFELPAAEADAEFGLRLASMEAALARLDGEGVFGTGEARARTLLLVTTMPPDPADAAFARRLNPPGPLLTAWLDEASEGGAAGH